MATNEETKKLTNMILALEGTDKNSYVPTRTVIRNGKKVEEVIGQSGVTIGKGLDLGAQDTNTIDDLGLNETLANKLKNSGYLGKKGQEALNAHTAKIVLTEDEEKELNEKVISKYNDDFTFDYMEKVGRDPAELTENQRLALTSAYFNLGKGLFGPNLTKHLKNKDYDSAAKELMTWHSAIPKNKGLNNRRGTEAFLFAGYINPEDAEATRDMFNKNQEALTKYRATDFGSQNTTPPLIADTPYPEVTDRYAMDVLAKPNTENKEAVKSVQKLIGADVDGIWGPQSQAMFDLYNKQVYDNTVNPISDTPYREEQMPTNINTEPTGLENPLTTDPLGSFISRLGL